VLKCGPGGLELAIGVLEEVRHDFRVGEDRHEVGVAVPAGDDVEVDVVGYACTCNVPLVDAHVETIGMHRGVKRRKALLRSGHEIGQGAAVELFDGGQVGVGRDHEMAVVVWKEIHDDEATPAAIENQVLCVALLSELIAEDALSWFGVLVDVGHPPGGPEVFHMAVSSGERAHGA
jgi:hypothetical protein